MWAYTDRIKPFGNLKATTIDKNINNLKIQRKSRGLRRRLDGSVIYFVCMVFVWLCFLNIFYCFNQFFLFYISTLHISLWWYIFRVLYGSKCLFSFFKIMFMAWKIFSWVSSKYRIFLKHVSLIIPTQPHFSSCGFEVSIYFFTKSESLLML